jgi:hypothetical protein
MSELSYYESRPGTISCNADQAFAFITDLRNFGRFASHNSVTDWNADIDSCSFAVAMMGKVHVRIKEKEQGRRVVYEGDALSKNDFTIEVNLAELPEGKAEAKLNLSADLNPMMKMIADKPVRQFMEMLVQEMEKFSDWENSGR